jgi:hypothetical protein
MLNGKYQENNLTRIYKCLQSTEYAQLESHVHRFILVFGNKTSRYRTFSKMKYTTSYHRIAQTDEELQPILMMETTMNIK